MRMVVVNRKKKSKLFVLFPVWSRYILYYPTKRISYGFTAMRFIFYIIFAWSITSSSRKERNVRMVSRVHGYGSKFSHNRYCSKVILRFSPYNRKRKKIWNWKNRLNCFLETKKKKTSTDKTWTRTSVRTRKFKRFSLYHPPFE